MRVRTVRSRRATEFRLIGGRTLSEAAVRYESIAGGAVVGGC